MDPKNETVKTALNTLIFTALFLLLFVILIPVLVKTMDGAGGKWFYGLLTAGAVVVALRLRAIAKNL